MICLPRPLPATTPRCIDTNCDGLKFFPSNGGFHCCNYIVEPQQIHATGIVVPEPHTPEIVVICRLARIHAGFSIFGYNSCRSTVTYRTANHGRVGKDGCANKTESSWSRCGTQY